MTGLASPWSTARVDGVLAPFAEAGLVGPFEIQLASAAGRAAPDALDDELLALALVARATRLGHVCLDLDQVRRQVAASQDEEGTAVELPLPDVGSWSQTLASGSLVADPDRAHDDPLRPLVWDGVRLYLQRYWSFELAVAEQITVRSASAPDDVDGARPSHVDAALDAVFPPEVPDEPDLQRLAARRALIHPVTVMAGGPGTGKTHTVARILAATLLMSEARGESARVALAAPTGKAAGRMKEAVDDRVADMVTAGLIDQRMAARMRAVTPTTIHSLLGSLGRSGFRHDRANPVPHDLVIVDETSMVSLPLLARLLDALRPAARLVLVGDPSQLSSIEAGTVMADLVGPGNDEPPQARRPLAGKVTELRAGHRFLSGSTTSALSLAIQRGAADGAMALLDAADPEVHWIRPEDAGAMAALRRSMVDAARQIVLAGLAGQDRTALDAAERVKVLAAVRHGPNGLFEWSDAISDGVRDALPVAKRSGWPRIGMPVMVTANDPVNRLVNGDVGVVVELGGVRRAVIGGSGELRRLATSRLGEWEPWWAMTIHKSQGSEFSHAVVALPTVDSPILTRELLYTAVTRAKPEVTVVGSEEIIRLAISRPVARASGLRDRLWPEA
jgi:exodeoxyribonuclease V alpha subunit